MTIRYLALLFGLLLFNGAHVFAGTVKKKKEQVQVLEEPEAYAQSLKSQTAHNALLRQQNKAEEQNFIVGKDTLFISAAAKAEANQLLIDFASTYAIEYYVAFVFEVQDASGQITSPVPNPTTVTEYGKRIFSNSKLGGTRSLLLTIKIEDWIYSDTSVVRHFTTDFRMGQNTICENLSSAGDYTFVPFNEGYDIAFLSYVNNIIGMFEACIEAEGGMHTLAFVQEELIKEGLLYFKEEITFFLENKDKQGLDEEANARLASFPECLPKEDEALEGVLGKIDEYSVAPDDLLALVKEDEAHKSWLEALSARLTGEDTPFSDKLEESEWSEWLGKVCKYLIPIAYNGFVATVNGDTIRNDDIYIVNAPKLEFILTYWSEKEDIGELEYIVTLMEEGSISEESYSSDEDNRPIRNKPWILELELVKEGKYTITHKIGNGDETNYEFWVRHQQYDFACTVCGRDLNVTRDKLLKLFPSSQFIEVNTFSTEYFKTAIEGAELNTCYRQAHFFSQINHESNGLTAKIEYVNYDVEGLLTTWKENSHSKDVFFRQSFWDDEIYLNYANLRLFKKDSTSKEEKYKSNKTTTYKWSRNSSSGVSITKIDDFKNDTTGNYIKTILTNSKKIENGKRLLNFVYAAPVGAGNGDQASGDGYKYRGRGAIMLTGKGNYKEVSDKCNNLFGTNYDWENNPDQVKSDPKAMVLSASAYIVNRLGSVDELDTECTSENTYDKCVTPVTRLVNGGYNGLEDRKVKFKDLIEGMFNNCKAKK